MQLHACVAACFVGCIPLLLPSPSSAGDTATSSSVQPDVATEDSSATVDDDVADAHPQCDAGPYDPELALMLSLSSTFGGGALGGAIFLFYGAKSQFDTGEGAIIAGAIVTGLAVIIGPGAGHLYVGNYGWPIGRMAIRAALAGLGVFALMRWMSGVLCSDSCESGTGWGLPVFIVSSALFAFVAGIDFFTVKRAARRANERARGNEVEISFAPALFGSGKSGGGLAVLGRF